MDSISVEMVRMRWTAINLFVLRDSLGAVLQPIERRFVLVRIGNAMSMLIVRTVKTKWLVSGKHVLRNSSSANNPESAFPRFGLVIVIATVRTDLMRSFARRTCASKRISSKYILSIVQMI